MTIPWQRLRQIWIKARLARQTFQFMLLSSVTCLFLLITIPAHSAQPSEFWATDAATLLAQGQQAYQAGQFQVAAQQWQAAAHQYEQQHQPREQASSLNYLALSQQALGQWLQAEQTIQASLQLLKADPSEIVGASTPLDARTLQVLAQALNTYGSIQLALSQPEAALATWQQATAYYQQLHDPMGELGSQLNQAQALQTLGLYRRAKTVLEELMGKVQAQPDSVLKATSLRSLGNVLQVVGDLPLSKNLLEQSLSILETQQQPEETSQTLGVLANTLRALQQPEDAIQSYERLLTLTANPATRLETQLNLLSLRLEMQQPEATQPLITLLSQALPSLEPSRFSVYSRVNFVESALKFNQQRPASIPAVPIRNLAELLAQSVEQARELHDLRAQSMALGQLGQLYISTQQWSEAQRTTQQALQLAQDSEAKDIGYRWQWQLGRIYRQRQDGKRAIAAYTQSIETLQSVRASLIATHSELQFNFKEKVEPIYRELVSLLLAPKDVEQTALKQARELIEDLQLAELENYFRSACIDAQSAQIDQIDSEAAVIYPVILPDRLEVVLALPNQPLKHYRTQIPQVELEQTVNDFFVSFNPALSNRRRLQLAQQLYTWLIQPTEIDLVNAPIKTLVFVLDGALRNIPMATLYDGNQYLIEKYAVALTPGLNLLGPHFNDPKPLKALMLGVSESRQGFTSLPGVKAEIEEISANIAQAQVYLDQAFTKNTFKSQLKETSYPILHLATHGQFSSDLASTFLLAWDQKITLSELDTLLKERRLQVRNPIELMVLSACQTAEGDNRATLGLAGMAIKSGARSTLATLWSVNDESTVKLMTSFYNLLGKTTGITKAEALRQAQLSLLQDERYHHPFYWAPFVLVGNWLV